VNKLKIPAVLTLAVAVATTSVWLAASWATDVGVVGTRLALSHNTKTGRQTVTSVQKDADVHVGAAPGAFDLSAALEIYYVDTPANDGSLLMPSPFASTNVKTAKYRNTLAPGGPSPVKSALIQYGKLARVTASGLGGLDLSTPPGPGGIVTVLTINNAADSSTHRMCSLYSAASGSIVQHKALATGYRLTARRGVDVVCPNCADGKQNGDETDVDCGGPGAGCSRCDTGDGCSVAGDCTSGVCTAGLCQAPTCVDTVENGTETDVDCGGGSCPGCAQGEDCSIGSDCSGGVCSGGACQPESCTDTVENGDETDVDCGGSCTDCADGDDCALAGDCQSGVCTGNVCQVPVCSDGVKNGSETAIDCGGSCTGCADGGACGVGSDCQSGVCTGNVCQAATCADGVKNAVETDTDCGGGTCPDCPAGDDCLASSDCTSGVCTGNVCQTPTCSDGVKNGSESDVDCGGASCGDCALNKVCSVNGDCLTNFCTGGHCKCPSQLFTFQVNSNSGGLFDSAEWPGGTTSQNGPTGCSITINRPNNNIDQVCAIAAPFSVNGFAGYSSCAGTGGEDGDGCQPVSCPPAGIGSCCSGRPSCSAALNGSGTARYFVQCNP